MHPYILVKSMIPDSVSNIPRGIYIRPPKGSMDKAPPLYPSQSTVRKSSVRPKGLERNSRTTLTHQLMFLIAINNVVPFVGMYTTN